ncbi:MAG: hypothetical protein HGA85_02500 [Nanoarchaeota archaeon]|nr:hypothetical protein [Nanoarchaeota archaeon]
MTQDYIPKPDVKYAPLRLDADGKLLSFEVQLLNGKTIDTVLSDAGLLPQYYKWQEVAAGQYQVTGHYTCPP